MRKRNAAVVFAAAGTMALLVAGCGSGGTDETKAAGRRFSITLEHSAHHGAREVVPPTTVAPATPQPPPTAAVPPKLRPPVVPPPPDLGNDVVVPEPPHEFEQPDLGDDRRTLSDVEQIERLVRVHAHDLYAPGTPFDPSDYTVAPIAVSLDGQWANTSVSTPGPTDLIVSVSYTLHRDGPVWVITDWVRLVT
jgi:hypothetical protein